MAYSPFYRVLLQKRHMILRGLLIVATPYPTPAHSMQLSAFIYVRMEEETIFVFTPDAKITHQLSSGEVRTRWGQCVAVCCSVLQCVTQRIPLREEPADPACTQRCAPNGIGSPN